MNRRTNFDPDLLGQGQNHTGRNSVYITPYTLCRSDVEVSVGCINVVIADT